MRWMLGACASPRIAEPEDPRVEPIYRVVSCPGFAIVHVSIGHCRRTSNDIATTMGYPRAMGLVDSPDGAHLPKSSFSRFRPQVPPQSTGNRSIRLALSDANPTVLVTLVIPIALPEQSSKIPLLPIGPEVLRLPQ